MPEDRSDSEEKRQEEARKIPHFFGGKAPSKSIATHTVMEGDTLSHIAMKYYGNAGKAYYMHVFEANKNVIGDNPNIIKPGMELDIPELPEDLK